MKLYSALTRLMISLHIGKLHFHPKYWRYKVNIDFANGLKHQLEQSLIEMNLQPKYELAVVGVPAVVKEWANKKITFKKSKSRCETNVEAYKLGNQHGLEYEVERTDLLENKKDGSTAII